MGAKRRNRHSRSAGARTGRLILVIGGASSGKTDKAMDLAARGLRRASRKALVATGEPLDEEMAERIQRHRASRGAEWETHEVPVDLATWFEKHGREYSAVLVDCLTLWLNNSCERMGVDAHLEYRVAELVSAMRTTGCRTVVVTNELGLGLVPMEPGARRFRDLAGRMNRQFADAADVIYFVVAGQALRLKG